MEFSHKMACELQLLFAKLLYTNQSYVDPSDVLNNVVDDSGYPCPVGNQQDSMEYLMNFMERLEEGLGEDSANITRHLRVSAYHKQKNAGDNTAGEDPTQSFLTEDDTDLARSTQYSAETAASASN